MRVRTLVKYVVVSFSLLAATTGQSQWRLVQTPLYGGQYDCLLVSGDKLLLSAEHGIFASTDQGYSWNRSDSGLDDFTVFRIYSFAGTLFAGNKLGICASKDNGVSWYKLSAGIPTTAVFSFTAIGSTLFAGTVNQGIFYSTDNGQTWQPRPTAMGTSAIYAMATVGSLLFAVSPGLGVYSSSDTGATWKLSEKIPFSETVMVNGNMLFVGAGDGVYRSADNGLSWTHVTKDITTPAIMQIAAFGNNIFAGSAGGGIFFSSNNGTTWSSVNDGMTDRYLDAIAVQGSYIFAGSYDASTGQLWQRPLSNFGISSSVPIGGEPEFDLGQNFPNPTRGITSITFSIPDKAMVTLTVCDQLGKERSTIVSEELIAGSYTRQYSTAGLSPGVYFCRLQAGRYSATKLLVVD